MARCSYCNGTGKAYSQAIKKYVTCDNCAGRGNTFTKCSYCNGTGKAYSQAIKQYVTCDACRGKGER